MSDIIRLCDTGVRSAAENMTLDRVMLEARSRDEIPDTLRFLMFDPPAVLVGRYQSVTHEVRREYCETAGYDVNRRITGGGAILFDRTCLGWELIGRRGERGFPYRIESIFRELSAPIIAALRSLGVDAEFRGRNDIEVQGRKICGTGGAEEGEAFLFQGTLLVDMDPLEMLRSLRVPVEKLSSREISSFNERVTCLAREMDPMMSIDVVKEQIVAEFAKTLQRTIEPAGLTADEEQALQKKLEYHNSNDWIYSVREPKQEVPVLRSLWRAEGGVLRCSLTCSRHIIGQVYLSGDFFSFPDYGIARLEESLKDCPARPDAIESRIRPLFEDERVCIPGVTWQEIQELLLTAARREDLLELGIPKQHINKIFCVNGTVEEIVQKGINLLLLPYCAKPLSCELRHQKDCLVCNECTISEPWEQGSKRGWFVETIVSYEDLEATLERYQQRGVQAFIGSCCEAFWARHQDDFRKIGLPGILIDIDSTTCYDLGKEQDAYAGSFEGETDLTEDLILQVIELAGTSRGN